MFSLRTLVPRPYIGVLALSSAIAADAAFAAPSVQPQPAERGAQAYNERCAECHSMSLKGTGHGAELAGPNFVAKWSVRTTAELLDYISQTMPPDAPHSLPNTAYEDIVAYILQRNGSSTTSVAALNKETPAAAQPGEPKQPLTIGEAIHGEGWQTPEPAEQVDNGKDSGRKSWQEAGSIAAAAETAGGFDNREAAQFTSVSSAELNDPPAQDWLTWRRTLDGQGYSPLRQIDRSNVGDLKLAWVLMMHEGSNQGTPLVRNGTMFLTHPGNVVQAINAESGDLIWEYRHAFPAEARTLGGPTRNIALYEDQVFLTTYDAAVVAIDARTGKLRWQTRKADYTKGYTHTAGPIIAEGVVISGINGCERYKEDGCFVTGHDAETGKELWRTSTIAMSGEPYGDTWGELPDNLRAGGDTWMPGSYDPALNTFYIGTSQAKPWVAASRGMSPLDAALYTNSTLALNPKTGAIKWHFQHIPGETLDMEVGFERVLLDIDDKPLVLTIGKDAILWKLDRRTGEFLQAAETMPQNVFTSLDPKTGKVTYRQDIIDAKIGEPVSACPGIYGGHNWQASAYYPPAQTLVIPLHQLCVEMVGQEVKKVEGYGGYGGESRSFAMPDSGGKLGRLSAFNVKTMQETWRHEQRAMFLTSALTTAGGLAFIGDLDRYFKAFDVDSGELLWQTRLGSALHGYPITYGVNGKQYVAVQTGLGVFKLLTAEVSPEIYQPNGGNALYVFELPDE